MIGHSHGTIDTELARVGRALFGAHFRGVFAADEVPALTAAAPYAVFNADRRASAGSHWLAAARDPAGSVVVYDSFGRPWRTVADATTFVGTDADLDAEQSVRQTNCGQRALAWLLVADEIGVPAASLV